MTFRYDCILSVSPQSEVSGSVMLKLVPCMRTNIGRKTKVSKNCFLRVFWKELTVKERYLVSLLVLRCCSCTCDSTGGGERFVVFVWFIIYPCFIFFFFRFIIFLAGKQLPRSSLRPQTISLQAF